MDVVSIQWILVVGSSLILFWIAPWAKSKNDFFRGSKLEKEPGFWMLTSSLVISWLFAKSITNAANLGLSFGFVGGLAYATYYLSFLTAGIIIYGMRVQGGFVSLHHFLNSRYGRGAVILFSILISFRLLNEVWSNTMVIGSYFGDQGSSSYYWAIILFTLLTVAYTIKGGLRSSLLTDLIQMILFGILLFVILGMILPEKNGDVSAFVQTGNWTMAGGLNLLFVALIQVFSYPFHDPVLTDRAFISSPKTTLRSFIAATFIGGLCIILFSFVGIYGQMEGLEGQAPVEVGKLLGLGMQLMMNFIMITSAASTLDSTFNSFSKLVVVDLSDQKRQTISWGRRIIILIAVLGTIPVFLGAEILAATTISGTTVIGLTPIFIFWKKKAPRWSYFLSVGTGMLFGICLAIDAWPDSWIFTNGKYAELLAVNSVALLACFVGYFVPFLKNKAIPN